MRVVLLKQNVVRRSLFMSLRRFLSFSGLKSFSELEERWIPVIRKSDERKLKLWDNVSDNRKSFILSMFPYPSGNLHMGHLRVYTVSDVLSRYKSMCGYVVMQPMGWDAFGLPAENAAIDRVISPSAWTKKNIDSMYEQLNSTMMLNIDWSRELATCDSQYYKWTQWLFLKLYSAGLVYERSAFVNWDPVDKTVLADELIDADGRSWRSGALVERRPLRQWYFRTTVYSESLLDGLTEIESQQWRDVVNMQRGWLGNLNGTQMEFDVKSLTTGKITNERSFSKGEKSSKNERLVVFTKLPSLAVADFISFIKVGPDSIFYSDKYRMPEDKRGMNSSRKLVLHSPQPWINNVNKPIIESTSSASPWPERLAISVLHPFTGRDIPVIRENSITNSHIRAYPNEVVYSLDHRSQNYFKLLDLGLPPGKLLSLKNESPTIQQLEKMHENDLENYIIASPVDELHGKKLSNSIPKAMKLLQIYGRGGYWCDENRTDWLVSRQRYWGTPIPIIHCDSCGAVPVPEEQLPVLLPPLENPLKRGDVPLKDNETWKKTICPKCGQSAERETDTLDTFVDSSWYYLRYLDPQNKQMIFDPVKAINSLPVDIYVGGVEHAIRHLYYARFIAHFLHNLGIIPNREPFKRFLPVGLVLGQTFKEPKTGRFVSSRYVEHNVSAKGKIQYVEKNTNLPLQMYWDKMSKSKLNGVDPNEVVNKYGREIVRITMLTNVGPHKTRKWHEGDILQGVINWTNKLNRLVEQTISQSVEQNVSEFTWLSNNIEDDPLIHCFPSFISMHESIINRVNEYYGETFVISAAVARLQELTEILRRYSYSLGGPGIKSFLYLRALADLLVMFTPISPIYACELWSGLQLACSSSRITDLLLEMTNTEQSNMKGYLFYWPYNLEKLVIEQPFPILTLSEQSDQLTSKQHAECNLNVIIDSLCEAKIY